MVKRRRYDVAGCYESDEMTDDPAVLIAAAMRGVLRVLDEARCAGCGQIARAEAGHYACKSCGRGWSG